METLSIKTVIQRKRPASDLLPDLGLAVNPDGLFQTIIGADIYRYEIYDNDAAGLAPAPPPVAAPQGLAINASSLADGALIVALAAVAGLWGVVDWGSARLVGGPNGGQVLLDPAAPRNATLIPSAAFLASIPFGLTGAMTFNWQVDSVGGAASNVATFTLTVLNDVSAPQGAVTHNGELVTHLGEIVTHNP